jgi:GMP synthase-like glutamine amidotransferase
MILIVDMNWKQNSLGFNEFVLPIVSVVEPLDGCVTKHFLDIQSATFNDYSKIILSGTALKDHATLQQIEKFNWIKKCTTPILGICAGMQTISLAFDATLTSCLHIGMAEITTLKDNLLFEGDFKAYELHNLSVQQSKNFVVLAQSSRCVEAIKHQNKDIYGVLFHPEVRNQEIIERFLSLET